MRAVRGGLVSFRHFFGSRRGGGQQGGGITSDRKDGPIGEMSDDEASCAAHPHQGKKLLVGDAAEDEIDVDNECCICLVDMEELKFRGKMDCCDHVVCWFCIQEWAQTSRSCPICQRTYTKCKKTAPKPNKNRKHTKADANGAKGKKQRSLWEKVKGGSILSRRFRSARPSPPPSAVAAQSSWSDDDNEVGAGDEEVIIGSPMRDSLDSDEAAPVADGSNRNSRSSEEHSEVDGNNANDDAEEGNDMIVVNVNSDANPEEPVVESEEAEVEVEIEEELTVVADHAGVSSSSSSSTTSHAEESEAETTNTAVTAQEASNCDVDKAAAAEEEEEEVVETTPGNNFTVERDDQKGKEKMSEGEGSDDADDDDSNVEATEEDNKEEEEEWERKGSESDDDDSDDEEECYDNGPRFKNMPEDDEY